MPRLPINYSKTVIYKLVHKEDYDNDNVYIGSTTDFRKRKTTHKSYCNNEKNKTYNDKKYQYIRANGGWENWNMIEVEKYPCNDKREAEKREEYYRAFFNANLNSIKAFRTKEQNKEHRVATGADILAAGFVVRGTTPRRLLIRAVGPTLSGFGVTGVLADPKLEVFRQGTEAPLATNDNWSAPISPSTSTAAQLTAAFSSVGAFALTANSRDAALIITLPAGTYTAQVSGVNNTTGVAIVEVYDLP